MKSEKIKDCLFSNLKYICKNSVEYSGQVVNVFLLHNIHIHFKLEKPGFNVQAKNKASECAVCI